MKRFLALCVLAGSFHLCAAEDDRLKEVIEKRGALLAEIHDALKEGVKAGRNTSDEASAAAFQLYIFRRDNAKTPAERVRWQEEIFSEAKREVADVKSRISIGVMGPLDLSRAEERVLAAEQKLLELQREK